MTIKILFFGAVADATGKRSDEIEVAAGEKVGAVIELLTALAPKLSDLKLLVAINEEYADVDALLKAGDQIAIFTAVSGG
jgi:molybdopterin converting factor subunit 1